IRGKKVQEQIIETAVKATVVPFKWSSLESTNFQSFINNLRSVKCPERTITDIIRPELTRAYSSKFAEIVRTTALSDPLSRIQERGRKQLEINREIESIMYDELKLQRPVRSANSLFTAE